MYTFGGEIFVVIIFTVTATLNAIKLREQYRGKHVDVKIFYSANFIITVLCIATIVIAITRLAAFTK